MATSAPQTPIHRRSTDLTSPPSPLGLTPAIVNAKSKRRRHRHRREERERALLAGLTTALPQRPVPLDGVDELRDPIANPAADNNNSQGIDRNHGEDGESDQHDDTTDHNPNNDRTNINYVCDSDARSSPIAGIGLRPNNKPIEVVVDNTNQQPKRRARSSAPIEDDELAAPSMRRKRPRLAPNRHLTRQGAVQAAARVRDPDPVVADRPCVRCAKNLFVLDKATGKVVGPAVCVLKRRRAKRCTRCAEGNKKCIPLPASLVGRALALARMRRTREAAHQTLEFRYDIDAELHKANERKARATVPVAGGGCGAGTAGEAHQFWRQVQLSVLYHTFQLRNEIRSLKNFAPVPASEMLVSLDEFDNALAGAGNDESLDFLEEVDEDEGDDDGSDDGGDDDDNEEDEDEDEEDDSDDE
ncbi:hypothetical protein BDV11DRAFT_176204 [Aspergillus similis]